MSIPNEFSEDALAPVHAAEAEWVEIYLRNDADAFADLITDDFVYTSPVGEVVDHDTYITNLRDDVVHMDYIHPEDLLVRRYGEQTAVVTGTWKVKERYKDDQAEGAFRIIRVWIKQPDRWRAAAFQVTLVDPRPAAAG